MSFAAAVMFAPVGRISDAALCVRTAAPRKRSVRLAPAAITPKPVIAALPLITTMFDVAAPISTVEAEAIEGGGASLIGPERVPPDFGSAALD
ncbi:hypothetical protein D3C71_1464670 [compost metagenome]